MRIGKKERQQRILQELQIHPHVRVATLAERFDVATETIRRDLDALSENGLIKREFGGASAQPMGHQPDLAQRQMTAVAGFERIGIMAGTMIRPGDVIMIDAGSTVSQLAPYMAQNPGALRRTVLTNCYAVVHGMGEQAVIDDVIMCPGQFDPRENAVYGNDTVEFLRRFHANKAFIGASGVAWQGFSDVNRRAVAVKRAMMERSDETWLMVDHTKFDQRYLENIAPLEALTGVITDRLPPEKLLSHLDRIGLQIVAWQDNVSADQGAIVG
ncbi:MULTISPECIES: DeoR/GlpR family DNA-binding transcription regulator [Thalassospira]|uniref:DeoR/GlpR family DNA-binding transcription regulator n=1 Tax=Thalassospira TaxID=168934 RepID=UPI0009F35E8C|nr:MULTISPECIES: DeoR/GlpR family DNA-binding transcription regulator [Thalassospira]MAB34864.1 DeoR/GlpR transcriptional regulator [Thalassospira sp.]MDM7976034.1 DeoR/GlpR family DNA-binding transcription regulator [Thalassospira xiamenensis]HBS21967.1 DeoR/GlpR transcriptional regulator [Thalassospira sp.]